MPIKDLRDKYGKNKNPRKAINAAIRAELVGGDDVLDCLDRLDRTARRLKERDLAGQYEAQNALDSLRALRDLMSNIIADRYNLKNTE